jgi:hypothetical protein
VEAVWLLAGEDGCATSQSQNLLAGGHGSGPCLCSQVIGVAAMLRIQIRTFLLDPNSFNMENDPVSDPSRIRIQDFLNIQESLAILHHCNFDQDTVF